MIFGVHRPSIFCILTQLIYFTPFTLSVCHKNFPHLINNEFCVSISSVSKTYCDSQKACQLLGGELITGNADKVNNLVNLTGIVSMNINC